ncbi:ArsR family transcriptional regulator, partial [Micrococcus luteus]
MSTTTAITAAGLETMNGPEEYCTLSAGPVDSVEAERIALLKALSDPTRLRLLSHVAAQGCNSVCACDLTELLGISQPTVSHHMK